jgi:hypothetical protein
MIDGHQADPASGESVEVPVDQAQEGRSGSPLGGPVLLVHEVDDGQAKRTKHGR